MDFGLPWPCCHGLDNSGLDLPKIELVGSSEREKKLDSSHCSLETFIIDYEIHSIMLILLQVLVVVKRGEEIYS
jgi:hypothetical protein